MNENGWIVCPTPPLLAHNGLKQERQEDGEEKKVFHVRRMLSILKEAGVIAIDLPGYSQRNFLTFAFYWYDMGLGDGGRNENVGPAPEKKCQANGVLHVIRCVICRMLSENIILHFRKWKA